MRTSDLTAPRYLFLVGAPRSGTKLLRELLNRNEEIFILENETDIYPALLRFFAQDNGSTGWFNRLFARIGQTKFFLRRTRAGMSIDPDDWRMRIAHPTAAAAFAALMESAAGERGTQARIIGDKSPLHLDCVGSLLHDFPEGRVIHLVRDGRETSLSALDAWGKNPLRAIAKWTESTLQADDAKSERPSHYILVNYERLVENPDTTLQSICTFLQIPYSENMLTLDRTAENLGRAAGMTSIMPPKQHRAFDIDRALLQRMEEVFLPAARHFGYHPITNVTSVRELSKVELAWMAFSDGMSLARFHVKELGLFKGLVYALSRCILTR